MYESFMNASVGNSLGFLGGLGGNGSGPFVLYGFTTEDTGSGTSP